MSDYISILIIDDSNVIHALLNKILTAAGGIKIAGNAHNGEEGISMTKNLSPDIIIMDIMMPRMNGLDAISIIMDEKPTPIIVFSAANREIVDLSFKAIDLGAVDIIEKPEAESIADLQKIISGRLVKSIKTFRDFRVIRRIKKTAAARLKRKADDLIDLQRKHERGKTALKETVDFKKEFKKPETEEPFPVIGIASSTGGPQTVKQLLSAVSYKTAGCSYIVVQHLAMGFLKGFCDWINKDSAIPVEIAMEEAYVYPGRIYIAPEGYHLTVNSEQKFCYSDDPPIVGIKPSADILFKSLGEVFGERTVALILTGMGSDGSKGIREIKKNGGYIIAQDEASSYIFGMPKAAIETGLTDEILSIYEIPNFLEKFLNERYSQH